MAYDPVKRIDGQSVKSITGSGISLMPEGLEQAIDHQQMSDLMAWLLESR